MAMKNILVAVACLSLSELAFADYNLWGASEADSQSEEQPLFYHKVDVSYWYQPLEDEITQSYAKLSWDGLFRLDRFGVAGLYLGPYIGISNDYIEDSESSEKFDHDRASTTVGGSIYYTLNNDNKFPVIGGGYFYTSGDSDLDLYWSGGHIGFSYPWTSSIVVFGARYDVSDNLSLGVRKLNVSYEMDDPDDIPSDFELNEDFVSSDLDSTFIDAAWYLNAHFSVSLSGITGDYEAIALGVEYKQKMFSIGLGYVSKDVKDEPIYGIRCQWNFGGRRGSSIQEDDRTSFLLDKYYLAY